MSRRSFFADVVIASGASLSDAIDVTGHVIVGLSLPTIDNAALTFQVAEKSDGTFRNLYDDAGNEVVIPASTGARSVAVPAELVGWSFVKVRSGTSGAAVNQTAERTIRVQALAT